MAAQLKTVRLEPSYDGIDVDSSPNAVAKGKGQAMQNYLTGEKGRIRQRGAITDAGTDFGFTGTRIAGTPHGNDRLLVGSKLHTSATQIIEPWVAPYKPSAATALARAYGTAASLQQINLNPVAYQEITPTNRTCVPGPRFARYGKWVYSIGYDSGSDTSGPDFNSDIVTNGRGGWERQTKIMRWDTTLSVTPVAYTFTPKAAQDIRIHYGRLLVLGGTSGLVSAGANAANQTIRHNRMRYTRQLDASDFAMGFTPNRAASTAALRAVGDVAPTDTVGDAWTDEITLAQQILDLPGPQSDFGVAMASVGRNLAILKRNSIVVLTGYGPSTWQLKTAAESVGCLDPRSVVESNEGVFFLSKQGYMFFDGTQVVDVSVGVHRLLLTQGLAAVGDNGTAGGYAVATKLANNYIMLTVGVVGFAASPPDPTTTFCGLYHIPSNSWSTFTSAAFAGNTPYWVGATETRQYAADDTQMRVTNEITLPENVAEASRGFDEGSTDTNIVTSWYSRTVELAAPFHKAKLHRIIVDYQWIVDGQLDEFTAVGPTVTVFNSIGSNLFTYVLPSGPQDAGTYNRKRHTQELFIEANDIFISISYSTTARALVQSSIQDVWIEYSDAQPKHGSTPTA